MNFSIEEAIEGGVPRQLNRDSALGDYGGGDAEDFGAEEEKK